MDEWEHVLEQYDYEDVSRELDDFLKANYTFAPRLNELTYHLKTLLSYEFPDKPSNLQVYPCTNCINYL